MAEVVSHDPEEVLADYARQQADIQLLRNQLKDILNKAMDQIFRDT